LLSDDTTVGSVCSAATTADNTLFADEGIFAP
jgi:hypothetical protein